MSLWKLLGCEYEHDFVIVNENWLVCKKCGTKLKTKE